MLSIIGIDSKQCLKPLKDSAQREIIIHYLLDSS